MKYIVSVFVLLCICAFSSCNKNSLFNSDVEKVYQTDGVNDTIEGTPLTLDSTILLPLTLQCVDSFLIVMNSQSGSLLNVFNSCNDSLLAQFGDIGHARNEFLSPVTHFYCGRSSKEKLLLRIQNGGTTVQNVDLYASIKNKSCVLDKPIIHKDIGFYTSSFFLNRGKQLIHKSSHAESDVRDGNILPPYTEIVSGKNVLHYSPYPVPIVGDDASVSNAYAQTFKIGSDLSIFVEVPFFANLFYILDIEKGEYTCVKEENGQDFVDLQNIVSNYSTEDGLRQMVFYNVELCVSDNFIFLIHDGHRLASEIDSGDWSGFIPNIRIFDKEGNLINAFFLRESIYYIAYNEVSKKLYGIDTNKKVYVYDISKYIKELKNDV